MKNKYNNKNTYKYRYLNCGLKIIVGNCNSTYENKIK